MPSQMPNPALIDKKSSIMKTIRWGIAGLGKIAGRFASDLALVEGATLQAVASRSLERAREFAQAHGAGRAYGSFAELAQDPEVDIVYVAAPHTDHHPLTLLCLRAGKPVLCEKPFAMHLGQVQEMVQLAQAKGLFLMEALWTKFNPHFVALRELLAMGTIGQVVSVHANFAFVAPDLPEKRLLNKQLGGGALLDIGIYPIFLATSLLGRPEVIQAQAVFGPTGVDEQCNMLLDFGQGQTAVLSCGLSYTSTLEAYVHGTQGYIRLHSQWHGLSPALSVYDNQRQLVEEIAIASQGNGLNYEARAATEALRAGHIESPVMSHTDSLLLMETLDRVRAAAGIHYE